MEKRIGVWAGKAVPPTRGHLTSILKAHALCDFLYVVISDREDYKDFWPKNLPYPDGPTRKMWLKKEFQNVENIEVVLVDESNLPSFPDGWGEWAELVKRACPGMNVIFGGEPSYQEGHNKHFPGVDYVIIDPSRSQWDISATRVRDNLMKHWDYLVGSARPFFAKKVLLAGTESCGKTTITNKLAKSYYTSWSDEAGRYYSDRYFGGDEGAWKESDFLRIGHLQYEQDLDALSKANRVCFFDSGPVETEYYSELYLGKRVDLRPFISKDKYDLILFMEPTVKWVDDGKRFSGEDEQRKKNSELLLSMYRYYGFGDRVVVISDGDYYTRLTKCFDAVEKLLGEYK